MKLEIGKNTSKMNFNASKYKGIILAGGSGTRLQPLTNIFSKQFLPIYDKPMIYYPLATLMEAKIRDILIISTPEDTPKFQELLGDGSNLGINLFYETQKKPNGIAEAFIIGENFIDNSPVSLILGDNIFNGYDFSIITNQLKSSKAEATILGYRVSNPERFGVVDINKKGEVLGIEEKPNAPKSNFAVVGLYFYDKNVCNYAKNILPSPRGELEITDLNKIYLQKSKLNLITLDSGFAWLDSGTPDSLIEAAQYVKTIEDRQGKKIGCIEEIAYLNQWINKKGLRQIIKKMKNTKYKEYLQNIISKK